MIKRGGSEDQRGRLCLNAEDQRIREGGYVQTRRIGGSEGGSVLGQTEEPAGAEGFGLLGGAVLGGDL